MKSCIGFTDGLDNPVDVLARINTDMGGDQRQEHMLGRVQRGDPDSLTPRSATPRMPLAGEQLEAASMQPGQYRDRHALIDRDDAQGRKVRNKSKSPRMIALVYAIKRDRYVADISETLGAQKFLSDVSAERYRY